MAITNGSENAPAKKAVGYPAGEPRSRINGENAPSERVLLTAVGLRIPDQLPFEEWERTGRRLNEIVSSLSWCLGDWLVYGKENYSDRYKKATRAAGLQYQTLRNYAWVAHRFPWDRRRAKLTFQHHAEVASLPTEKQDWWLDRAEQQLWTTKQLRTQLRSGRGVAGSDVTQSTLIPRIEVPDAKVTWWREAADRSGMEFENWIMVTLDGGAVRALGQEEPAA